MSALRPDWYCASVLDIDPDALVCKGFGAVLLDLDNTLQARDCDCVGDDICAWVDRLKAHQLAACILSNSAKERVHAAAELLGVPVFDNAHKPCVGGYRRACAELDVAVEDALMVGDQTYTDILGAHRAGMRAVLVVPLCDSDLPHTRLLRKVDAWATRDMQPRPFAA